jgi:hypothetical protein
MEHPPFWAASALAEFVRERASWRRTQAQRFPDDARNAESADALEQLAMHVEALPDTDRSLVELIELDAFDDQDRFIASEEARRTIARWGFGDATSHMRPRDLLRDLVAITHRARRRANERKTKVTSATATRAIPQLPKVLWFKAKADGGKKHAAEDRVEGNLVRTYCGEVFDFPEVDERPSPYAGACPLCELALDKVDGPLPQPGKHELREAERDVMYDLLTLAHATDRECQVREKVLSDAIAADPTNYSDELGAYVMALTKLHAAIAPAALARMPILAPLARKDGALIELLDLEREEDLERFLRPLFNDAGIQDPFLIPSRERTAAGAPHSIDGDPATRRRYRFLIKLGTRTQPGPGQRVLSVAEQAAIFRGMTEWQALVIDGRKIGRSRYTEVTGDTVRGEAIIEPGATLPEFLEVEHIESAGMQGNQALFNRSRIFARPQIDAVEELPDNEA